MLARAVRAVQGLALLASAGLTGGFLLTSFWNYPGGAALVRLPTLLPLGTTLASALRLYVPVRADLSVAWGDGQTLPCMCTWTSRRA